MKPILSDAPTWISKWFPFSWRRQLWWNLDMELAKWIAPELRKMSKETISYPHDLEYEEWKSILAEMAEGFELLAVDDPSDERPAKVQRSFDLLAKYHTNLWD